MTSHEHEGSFPLLPACYDVPAKKKGEPRHIGKLRTRLKHLMLQASLPEKDPWHRYEVALVIPGEGVVTIRQIKKRLDKCWHQLLAAIHDWEHAGEGKAVAP